jgi:ABC-2 type transport system ATP-binding protein
VSGASSDDAARRPPAISAAGLTKQFGDEVVVDDLHLEIDHGTIVGLIGPSGCGKTTTVRMLAGLLSPSEGTVEVDGRPAMRLSSSERARIGYLPQTPALFPELSLWENLSFYASMYGLPLRRRKLLRSLLDWVELTDDRRKRVSEVSGGMQRRLALAATFVHDPAFVFLDEPTAGIDPILREKFWERFRALAAEGKTVLVTTQYVGEASYCDLVGLLTDGELLMLDTPAKPPACSVRGRGGRRHPGHTAGRPRPRSTRRVAVRGRDDRAPRTERGQDRGGRRRSRR